MDVLYTIHIYRLYFKVIVSKKARPYIMKEFVSKFNTYHYVYNRRERKNERVISKTFVGMNVHMNEYRFNITTLNTFIWHLKCEAVSKDMIYVHRMPLHDVEPIDVKIAKGLSDREPQIPYIKNLTNNNNVPAKLVGLQTGKGKTYIALKSLCIIAKTTAIIIRPQYIEKWVGDIKKNTNATDKDIIVVRGAPKLEYLVELARDGAMDAKFIIFSNRTLYFLVKYYELLKPDDEFKYTFYPDELMPLLGVGIILVDEVHQEFYTSFKLSMYFDVYLFIGLTATLESDDAYITRLYNVLFPVKDRLIDPEYDRYVTIYSIQYGLRAPKRIHHEAPGGRGYSHMEFEKSIIRDAQMLHKYMVMINYYVHIGYIKRKVDGDKLVIFASSIDMCTKITNFLMMKYPELDIRRYVEDDPYENVIEADIRVTTVLSTGAAIDIPNLITGIQTVNIMSIQANKQTLGRLRKIDGKEMRFYYIWAKDLKKHDEYHHKRMTIWKPLASKYILEEYGVVL